jgi:hypothetical protein
MERRTQPSDIHPLVSGFACPSCAVNMARLATVVEWFFYLRCDACEHIWSHPERRRKQRRGALSTTFQPVKAELATRVADRRQA